MSHARFINCARKLYCEPWAILPAMHSTICDIFARHLAGESVAFGGPMDNTDENDPTEYDVMDGVAIIPLKGVISKDISSMERQSGATDLDDFSAMMASAQARGDVSAILMRVNSPGGTMEGVQDAADMVAELSERMPVLAYADGTMASAAYYIAAGATAIYGGKYAEVGSIGVFSTIVDQSGMYAQNGLRREVFKSDSTPYKAAGLPGTSLTPAQREEIQTRVEFLNSGFHAFVRSNRAVVDEALDGSTFIGAQAVTVGLMDSVATMAEAIRDAADMGRRRKM